MRITKVDKSDNDRRGQGNVIMQRHMAVQPNTLQIGAVDGGEGETNMRLRDQAFAK
jgi:hypothetical protein